MIYKKYNLNLIKKREMIYKIVNQKIINYLKRVPLEYQQNILFVYHPYQKSMIKKLTIKPIIKIIRNNGYEEIYSNDMPHHNDYLKRKSIVEKKTDTYFRRPQLEFITVHIIQNKLICTEHYTNVVFTSEKIINLSEKNTLNKRK